MLAVFRIQSEQIVYVITVHLLNIIHSMSFKSPLRARQSGSRGLRLMMSLTDWKHFPRGFGGYVSMEILGSRHRHDSSGTSQFSWYRDRTGMSESHYRHYALRHWTGLHLKASRHALQKKAIFGTIDGTGMIVKKRIHSFYVFRSLTFTKQMQSGGFV